MMFRWAIALSLASLAAPALAAQVVDYPTVPRSTCAAADALLGPPAHEKDGELQGYYSSLGDSTYLIVHRKAGTQRSFVPYSSFVHSGAGPFDLVGMVLGFTVILDHKAFDQERDSLPVRITLDDFTTLSPGPLRVGKQFGGTNGVQQLSVLLSRAAVLALLHSRSALVEWGRGHADLEGSDIGALRAFVRAEVCAPAGISRPPTGDTTRMVSVIPNGASNQAEFTAYGADEVGHSIGSTSSCDLADSLLGPRRDGEGGRLVGEHDTKSDSTTLQVTFAEQEGRDGGPWFHVHMHEAGPGPFPIGGLKVNTSLAIDRVNIRALSDSTPMTIRLDKAKVGFGAPLVVWRRRSEFQVDAAIVIGASDAAALLMAHRAQISGKGVSFDWGSKEIGALRAYERVRLCAPASITAKN